MMMLNFPALPMTLKDYLSSRDEILQQLQQGLSAFRKAEARMDQIDPYGFARVTSNNWTDESFRNQVDKSMWELAFEKTGFEQIMDATARQAFKQSLSMTVPAFTEDNIKATFGELFQSADQMFARSVVELFHRLDRRYRTNDLFKIDSKIVASSWFRPWNVGLSINHGWGGEVVNDLDRILQRLAGRCYERDRLHIAINTAWHDKPGPWVYRDEYLEVKGYKNGNAHIHFLRPDMVDKMNALIAEHYGANSLPAGR